MPWSPTRRDAEVDVCDPVFLSGFGDRRASEAGDRRRKGIGASAVTGSEDTGAAAALVVRLTIEDGEPFAGSVSTEDGTYELAFSGWLGLVETLTLLRRRTRRVV